MSQPVDESELLTAVLRYQATQANPDAETVLGLLDPIINGMLARALTLDGVDLDEARSRIWLKVWKALHSYRPGGGRVFSYFNAVVQNYVRTICNERARYIEHFVPLGDLRADLAEGSTDSWKTHWAVEDISYHLSFVRTLCVKPAELEAQRWLVRSLISSEFSLPRHEAVRALRIVFGVDLRQGRLIHDRTMLELRRTVLGGRERFRQINTAKFRDRREKGLLKWKPYLSEGNFARLTHLMRGLPRRLSTT
jgi:hypothetical protein